MKPKNILKQNIVVLWLNQGLKDVLNMLNVLNVLNMLNVLNVLNMLNVLNVLNCRIEDLP